MDNSSFDIRDIDGDGAPRLYYSYFENMEGNELLDTDDK